MKPSAQRLDRYLSHTYWVLWLAVLLLLPGIVLAAAGKVEIVSGQVTATGADGTARMLAKGSEVDAADLIDTGSGRVQLHFTDGSHVVLAPHTRFKIEQYRFNGRPDGQEQGVFSLLAGGMRAITGLIGKSKPDAYAMRTNNATIGIRGTEYGAEILDGLRVWVTEGSIVVSNAAGSVTVNAGQSATVSAPDAMPVVTTGGGPSPGVPARISPCPA